MTWFPCSLSENPTVKVGVIEAGELRTNDQLVDTPCELSYLNEKPAILTTIFAQVLGGTALGNPDYDWGFLTTPQPDVNDRMLPLNRCSVPYLTESPLVVLNDKH